MTQDEIIEMANHAGFERLGVYAQFAEDWVCFTEELIDFAKLVAAKEREACAKRLEAVGCDHCAENIRARDQE